MDKVILYSTGCPKCRVLQAKLGIFSVPVLSIDGKLLEFSEAVKYLNGIEG